MGSYQHEEGKGRAFMNKKTSEKQPDYSGTFKYKGETLSIAMYKNEQYDSFGLTVRELQEKKDDNPF
jgi:hypothetical protein